MIPASTPTVKYVQRLHYCVSLLMAWSSALLRHRELPGQ